MYSVNDNDSRHEYFRAFNVSFGSRKRKDMQQKRTSKEQKPRGTLKITGVGEKKRRGLTFQLDKGELVDGASQRFVVEREIEQR